MLNKWLMSFSKEERKPRGCIRWSPDIGLAFENGKVTVKIRHFLQSPCRHSILVETRYRSEESLLVSCHWSSIMQARSPGRRTGRKLGGVLANADQNDGRCGKGLYRESLH